MKNIVYIALTCYNKDNTISPFYIKNKNNGIGNMLFQISSGLSYALANNSELSVPSLNTYLKLENLCKEETIFRQVNSDFDDSYDERAIIVSKCNDENIFNYTFFNNITLRGYFENYKNFHDIKPLVLEYFRPSEVYKKYILEKYPFVASDSISSIHIRRGDDYYKLLTPEKIQTHNTIYFNLIDYMIQSKNITEFVILTNDKALCQELFIKNEKYAKIIFHFTDERDFVDLWIMSLMKNNIVSNSTLSWWGSFLNENSNKFILGHRGFTRYYPEWTFI